jgi:hypothetical protein
MRRSKSFAKGKVAPHPRSTLLPPARRFRRCSRQCSDPSRKTTGLASTADGEDSSSNLASTYFPFSTPRDPFLTTFQNLPPLRGGFLKTFATQVLSRRRLRTPETRPPTQIQLRAIRIDDLARGSGHGRLASCRCGSERGRLRSPPSTMRKKTRPTKRANHLAPGWRKRA